ncbi:hypothetical protein MKX08_008987 [Trichoderma sp. CBMAI-0020]|nr:hypothetical protein MKX08_008987 [Trichoderma sp. CBMAI-0020]
MMPHGAINRDSALTKSGDGEPSHLSRPDLTSRKLPPPFGVASSFGPISPPPLKRNSHSAPPAPLDPCTSEVNSEIAGDWAPQTLPDRASLPLADRVAEHAPEASKQSGDASNTRPAGNMTPPSATTPSRERQQQPEAVQTPTARTVPITEWTVQKLANRLSTFNQEVRSDHSQLVAHAIESAKCREWRTHHGLDLFRNLHPHPNPEIKGKQVRIRFFKHNKNKKDHRDFRYNVVCIKTNKDAVPSYRFHHVEIKKNVLMPNTMLTFVPHLRDLEGSEEAKYNLWLKELEDIDLKSGFKPMNRDEKHVAIIQAERAAALSLYLDMWLKELNIAFCNKSTLVKYMKNQSDDSTTPRQKADLFKSTSDDSALSPEAHLAADMFQDAFQLVFKENLVDYKQVELRKVLFIDGSIDGAMDTKTAAKEVTATQQDNEDEIAESNLATYCILGCLICFSHSCDHGEYDIKNWKRTFSLSSNAPLSDILQRKRIAAAGANSIANDPCERRCYRLKLPPDPTGLMKPWSEDERILLRSLYVTTDFSKTQIDPICLATEFLNRNCDEVYAEFQSLNVSVPELEPMEPPRPRNISWYDRKRKMLVGDWQEHTITHEHQRRELLEPCSHPGPCAPKRQTVLINSRAAPVILKANRASRSPAYAFNSTANVIRNYVAHAALLSVLIPQTQTIITCTLQGVKIVIYNGVGTRLFFSDKDEFIVEYVGELITHDEGVRREARRGDVFDEDSNISYVFTLLENEGIWVDAAIYGNLSRYINHASEHDRQGCNITPRILYVNGEYRIKFTALRDIKAGEELFFNYGENFPNLTKKLLDHKSGEKPKVPRKAGRPKRAETSDRVARKVPKIEHKTAGRPPKSKKKKQTTARPVGRPATKRPATTKAREIPAVSDDDSAAVRRMIDEANSRKRKRHHTTDSEEEEYQPTGTEVASIAESGLDSEGVPLLDSKRLRKTTRSQRVPEQVTPTKPPVADEPKPRSKRGGARPGSGRPRKHPRVVPKPNRASAESPQPHQLSQAASQESRSEPESFINASTITPTPSMSTPAITPKYTRASRGHEPEDAIEIEDSEDQDVLTAGGHCPDITMTLYYSLVFALLMGEMGLFMLLLVPLPFKIKRKIFTFISESPLVAKMQYWMKITFVFILILFVDSVNRVYKVQVELMAAHEQSAKGNAAAIMGSERLEVQARKFYSQRNMYLCGFTLFLSLILNRTYVMILEVMRLEDKVKMYEGTNKNTKESEKLAVAGKPGELAALKEKLEKKDQDLQNLKKQAEQLNKAYSDLSDKYAATQIDGESQKSR